MSGATFSPAGSPVGSARSSSASPSPEPPLVKLTLDAVDLEQGRPLSTGADSTHVLLSPESSKPPGPFAGKGKQFWLVFSALLISSLLAALDLTGVATALPTMAAELDSDRYPWIGTAYALASTALIPWTGGLAAIFGRRTTMIGSLVFFAAGSAVTGSARTMAIAIAGRTIQGVGGGGILVMTDIMIVDLVPLVHRGPFYGILGLVWGLASAVGPAVGGALASSGHWRWLFYLNIPISAVAVTFVACFFNVKTPQTTWREKWAQMDYANLLFVASIAAIIVALSWGGVDYAWNTAAVVAPLVLGCVGLGAFLYIENKWVKVPTVPFAVLSHRNSLCGYIACFAHGVLVLIMAYYLPVWFQAILGASAVKGGVDLFSLAFTMTATAIAAGVSVTVSKRYLAQNFAGWALAIVGMGLMTLLDAESSPAAWICCPIVVGMGIGTLYTSMRFPTLAPLNVTQHPAATGFFNFVRCFGQVMGIVIGSTVLSNRLGATLPAEFLAKYGSAAETAIPYIRVLDEPLRHEVRVAFAESLRTVWCVGLGVGFLGLGATCFLREIEMAAHKDDNWGLEGEPATASARTRSSSASDTLYASSVDSEDKKLDGNEKSSVAPAYSPNLSTLDFPISLA